MKLPIEIRYRPYQEWSEKEKHQIAVNKAKSPWLTTFHLEPQTGLLNDPNGFSFFNGKFQLFYQNWPFGPAHGLKQWVHTESSDLIHFKETGIKLEPDHPHDSHGAYSGSAYAIDDKLFLFYTGNVRDDHWHRTPLQIGAWMTKDGQITKCEQILIEQPDDVTEHFRDPHIFDYQGQFFAIIGAQSLDKKGFIKLYKALNNKVHDWEFVGNLTFGSTGSEYMIECPNLVFVDGYPVLIYSPQGLSKTELDYDNIYPNTYKICQSFDTKKAELRGASDSQLLDYGFEAYATQAFNAPDGKVYSISWIGLPDIDYPTDSYDYQGAMSLVKELSIKDGKLYQYPVPAMTSLRSTPQPLTDLATTTNAYELELEIPANQTSELLLFSDEEGDGLSITVDTATGTILVDRSHVGETYATDFGTKRHCSIPASDTKLNIFVDKSIFEIFVNKGEKVFTGRVFPNPDQSGIKQLKGQMSGSYFELVL